MVQGEIIAAAIASDARVETGRLVIHADSLPTADESSAPMRRRRLRGARAFGGRARRADPAPLSANVATRARYSMDGR